MVQVNGKSPTTDEIREWISQVGVEPLAQILREIADRHDVQVRVGTPQGRARYPDVLLRAVSDLRCAMTNRAVPAYKGPDSAYLSWLEGVQQSLSATHWTEIRTAIAAAESGNPA